MIQKTSPNYKALMLDVDDTLVYGKDMYTLPTKKVTQAIQKAQKLGIHIALVTGRPYFFCTHIVKHLQLKGLVSVMNGAQIIEANTGKILVERLIDQKSLDEIIRLFKENNARFIINDDGKDIDYSSSYSPYKPFAVCTYGTPQEEAERLMSVISRIPTIDYHTFKARPPLGEGTGIAITHAEATKQHGILEVARILGINTHEIIGVGDGYNDFPMMMACGLRVAMGNAVPELKEIADYIAPSVEEDGVADVIEKYVLNQ